MNQKNLSSRLKETEKEINEMEKIDSIKKLVDKYNYIQHNIEDCKNILKNVSENINKQVNISLENYSNENYVENMNELEKIKQYINENMEKMELEELEKIYIETTKVITNCTNYLKNQKFEIKTIE